ncbi:hypothetical protein [Slackia heliotrinireducens]|uniref:hypothetical protein n=1 Tax=Slackia heliotrinireducens TaxID=84110 RepID=UPI003316374B
MDIASISVIANVAALVVVIAVAIAWLMATAMFVDLAKSKGHFTEGGSFALWFVGIFASPFVLGLYAVGLPNKHE